MKAKIKLEIKGKAIELEIEEAKELAKVLSEMTGIKIEKVIEHHDHYHDFCHPWYPYRWTLTCDSGNAGTYDCQIGDSIIAQLTYP